MSFARTITLAVAFAVVGVPLAHGNDSMRQSTRSFPLITEHSAGQNGITAQPVSLITEHSAGQNAANQPNVAARRVFKSASSTGSASVSKGFEWRDAGVGAGVAFAAILLAGGVGMLILRRGRGRLAGF